MIWILLVACGEPDTCTIDEADSLGELSAWEQDYTQLSPSELPPVQTQILNEDGLPLAFRDFEPSGWNGSGWAMLFLPGSSSHSGNYGDWGQHLADLGVYVRILDLRGHGLSVCAEAACGEPESVDRRPVDDGRYWTGRVGDSLDDRQITRDVSAALEQLASDQPLAQIALGGHSSGGGVVSRYVEGSGAPGVGKVVLLAPYNHPEQPQIREEVVLECPETVGTSYAQVDLGALGDALRGNIHRFVLQLNKSEQYTDPLDTTAYSYTTMTGMAASTPQDFWAAYRVPVLLLTGTEDHLLDPQRSEDEVYRATQGVFGELPMTSHIGILWSTDAAKQAAGFLQD